MLTSNITKWLGFDRNYLKGVDSMTAMTQDEIITNTKTVIQGLEALKNENHSILSGLLASLQVVRETAKGSDANTRLMEDKASIIQKSIESIELGLGEAQVMMALAGHLQTIEAEKQKLRAQVRRLCQENAWLRDELANHSTETTGVGTNGRPIRRREKTFGIHEFAQKI